MAQKFVSKWLTFWLTFTITVNGKSYLELTKLMFVELDGILRKYCLYVADGFINQELFELSSSPVSIGQIPSIGQL